MLKMGIVGLPNVGKSTLFSALTKKMVPAENYPFCTIDPSVGVVAVPDLRLTRLSDFSKSEKTVPAAAEFVDIAGLVKGASEGEGLGNQFLSHIRETDAVLEVVRFFDDADVLHVHGEVDPVRDMEVIDLELVLADLITARARRERLLRDVRALDKEAIKEDAVIAKVLTTLEAGKWAATATLDSEERTALKTLQLLTDKPVLYALNTKAGGHNLHEIKDERYTRALEYLQKKSAPFVIVDAAVERELGDVGEEDKEQFRREFGVVENGVDGLIRAAYRTLGLISFFTTGPEETRAWTIKEGAAAPEAGAAIHSDFRDKFIRAEVIPWDTLLEAGSYAHARDKGLIKTEGKDYLVKDGDTIVFLHG